jgi:hypothetical protein
VARKYLHEIAHSRAGDKGNSSNLSLVPFDEGLYDVLVEQVTEARVRDHFSGMVKGEVKRYCLPNVAALNFVLERSLAGGVTRSLALDRHGKTLSYHLLSLSVEVPEDPPPRRPYGA